MDYTAFWNGCQTANERKVKSMRSIEEIVRTILNSDALMEKVNHVVEIERMKYNRGNISHEFARTAERIR